MKNLGILILGGFMIISCNQNPKQTTASNSNDKIAVTVAPLKDGVSLMLAGGIGGGAINVLNNSGIEVIRGCSGDATEVVRMYLKGLVEDSGSSCHQHEAHHQDGGTHTCSHN
jgi:predicted Fe-Mo cluster-binding NifX family protein